MKNTAITLAIAALCGAGLMACSAESGGAEAQVQEAEKPMTASKPDVTILSFDDAGTKKCVKADAGDPVNIKLLDGAQVSIPKDWLLSVSYVGADGDYSDFPKKMTQVSQANFMLPVGEGANGCAETVSVSVHETDLAGGGQSYDKLNAFALKYTPVFAFQNLNDAEIYDYYHDGDYETSETDGVNLTLKAERGMAGSSALKSREWSNQQERITKYMSSIRVTEGFADYLGFVAEVSSPEGQHLGFLEYGANGISPKHGMVFYTAIGPNTTLSVPLYQDSALKAEFESLSQESVQKQSIAKNKLQYFLPSPSVGTVLSSLKSTGLIAK